MAGGQIFRSTKKKVLSNKALTKRVRGLTGKEGARDSLALAVYNNVTLVANTQSIKYIDLKQFKDSLIHTMRVWVAITTPESCYFRLILLEDSKSEAPNLLPGDILVQQVPWGAYGIAKIQPFASKRLEKNLDTQYQGRIVKDMPFAMNFDVTDEKKFFRFDVNFNGRKIDGASDWLFILISDEACVVDLQVHVDKTKLAN